MDSSAAANYNPPVKLKKPQFDFSPKTPRDRFLARSAKATRWFMVTAAAADLTVTGLEMNKGQESFDRWYYTADGSVYGIRYTVPPKAEANPLAHLFQIEHNKGAVLTLGAAGDSFALFFTNKASKMLIRHNHQFLGRLLQPVTFGVIGAMHIRGAVSWAAPSSRDSIDQKYPPGGLGPGPVK